MCGMGSPWGPEAPTWPCRWVSPLSGLGSPQREGLGSSFSGAHGLVDGKRPGPRYQPGQGHLPVGSSVEECWCFISESLFGLLS